MSWEVALNTEGRFEGAMIEAPIPAGVCMQVREGVERADDNIEGQEASDAYRVILNFWCVRALFVRQAENPHLHNSNS